MKKSSNPVKLSIKIAAELAAASAIMLGTGAFANAAPATNFQSDTTSSTSHSCYCGGIYIKN